MCCCLPTLALRAGRATKGNKKCSAREQGIGRKKPVFPHVSCTKMFVLPGLQARDGHRENSAKKTACSRRCTQADVALARAARSGGGGGGGGGASTTQPLLQGSDRDTRMV